MKVSGNKRMYLSRLNQILSFSIENKVNIYTRMYLKDIKLFFILFFINIFIYGKKIFFYSLATDDYARFYYSFSNNGIQASSLGRWATDLINASIFTEGLHVLPYFNSLLGVFCVTLSGFLTARYFKKGIPS